MISNKSAKQIVNSIRKYLDDKSSIELLMELSAVKSNESFHNSIQLILDLLRSKISKLSNTEIVEAGDLKS